MVERVIACAYWTIENIFLINIFRYWRTYVTLILAIHLIKKWETKFCFLCHIAGHFIHYRFSSLFATLIRVNRWGNWGKGLPWIGVAVKKGREWVSEWERRERKRDRPFRNFISTRLHLRDSFLNVFSFKMLSDPVAAVKNDRSKSDRLYFAEKWNFILSWNSLTTAFFIAITIETRYFG